MANKEFLSKVKEHLGSYKRNKLNVLEEGFYEYQNCKIPYEYILPKDKKELNVIERYRADFFNSEYSKIKLHKYFHHLNSSQAMCINFFFPLIQEKFLDLIIDIIGINSLVNYNSTDICFEKASELEKKAQRKTNFDFFIKLNSGIKIYFEIKYTENEFGKAKEDDSHKKKFNDMYMPLLKDSSAIKDDFKTEENFLNNYQIMRNLLQIDKDSYVVFIYPEVNKKIKENALYARNSLLKNGWEKYFILISWEDLIVQLDSRLASKELIDYYNNEFSYKYLKY